MAGVFEDLKRCGLMCWGVEINEICDPQKYSPQVATTRHCSLEGTPDLSCNQAAKVTEMGRRPFFFLFFLQDKTTSEEFRQ